MDLVPDGGDAVATLAGPAEDLLLALWKLISLDEADVQIGGAEDAVRQFVAGPISP